MRWQKTGENPGENCEEEHLSVLLVLLLSGKHLRGRSKPTPTEELLDRLCVGGQKAVTNFATDCCIVILLEGWWWTKIKEENKNK